MYSRGKQPRSFIDGYCRTSDGWNVGRPMRLRVGGVFAGAAERAAQILSLVVAVEVQGAESGRFPLNLGMQRWIQVELIKPGAIKWLSGYVKE
jgi:hypothetical protein